MQSPRSTTVKERNLNSILDSIHNCEERNLSDARQYYIMVMLRDAREIRCLGAVWARTVHVLYVVRECLMYMYLAYKDTDGYMYRYMYYLYQLSIDL